MVRTTSSRAPHTGLVAYKHRTAFYISRPGYVEMNDVSRLLQPVSQTITTDEFVLPPKQPTPNVILRSDIMPNQRTKVVL